jgi:hypothetical protein
MKNSPAGGALTSNWTLRQQEVRHLMALWLVAFFAAA